MIALPLKPVCVSSNTFIMMFSLLILKFQCIPMRRRYPWLLLLCSQVSKLLRSARRIVGIRNSLDRTLLLFGYWQFSLQLLEWLVLTNPVKRNMNVINRLC